MAGLKQQPTSASLTKPNQRQPSTAAALAGAVRGDALFRGEYSFALEEKKKQKKKKCWLTHLYSGWFPYGKPRSFTRSACTRCFPARILQINADLPNAGNNTLSNFSPEQPLYCNLGVFEATTTTTTNGNEELEVYSLCKARLSVVYDEVQRKSGKNLDGSSNADVLKMKARSSIKCLNKVFSY